MRPCWPAALHLHQSPTRYVTQAAEEGSLCADRSGARYRSKVALRQAQGFAVAAAKLRPTVAVVGGAGVEGEGTAAARQRQAARRRARLPFDARGLALRAPPQRRIMAPLCVRSPPATAREDAVRVWGFTRWGFRAQRRAGTERGSVPLALPGRGCVVGDAGNDRAEHRRRIV
jgi:hypothetical protein